MARAMTVCVLGALTAVAASQTLDELPGWSTWSPAPTVEFVSETQGTHEGNRALRIEARGPAANGCWVYSVPGFVPGHEYHLSAHVRTENVAEPGAVVKAEFWTGGGGAPRSSAGTQYLTGTHDWRKVETRFVVPNDTTLLKLTPYFTSLTGRAWFDRITLDDLTAPTLRLRVVGGDPWISDYAEKCPLEIEVTNATDRAWDLSLELQVNALGHEPQVRWSTELALEPGETWASACSTPLGGPEVYRLVALIKDGEREVARAATSAGVSLYFSTRALTNLGGAAKSKVDDATGFFHTRKVDDRWWLIDPEGHLFYSTGVNHVSYQGDYSSALGYSRYGRAVREKYASAAEWALAVKRNLRDWNFNTIGSLNPHIALRHPYTIHLSLGRRGTPLTIATPAPGVAPWLTFPDVFDPEFETRVDAACRALSERRDDPYIVGYFTDNEFAWWGLLEQTRRLPDDAPARRELARFEAAGYEGALSTAWDRHLAERYFGVVTSAVRKHDPNHMVLGHRFAGSVPDHLVDIVAEHCDVITLNFYNDNIPDALSPKFGERFMELGETAGRPIMITEWSFRGGDTEHPNTRGAGAVVPTQKARARAYASYALACAANPYIVGYHWFQYSDQPPEGRGNVEADGENSNYGLVDQSDTPHHAVTTVAREVNGRIYELASNASFAEGFAAKLGRPESLLDAVTGAHAWLAAPWLDELLTHHVPALLAETGADDSPPTVTLIPPSSGQPLAAVVRPWAPNRRGSLHVRGGGLNAKADVIADAAVGVARLDAGAVPLGLTGVNYELAVRGERTRGKAWLVGVNGGLDGGDPPAFWAATDESATLATQGGRTSPPCLALQRGTPGTSTWRSVPIPLEPGQALRLAGWFRGEGIRKGPGAFFHMGNAAVYFLTDTGEYHSHRDLFLRSGTFEWEFIQRTYSVPRGAAQVQVQIRLIQCAGALYADDLAIVIE